MCNGLPVVILNVPRGQRSQDVMPPVLSTERREYFYRLEKLEERTEESEVPSNMSDVFMF